MSRRLLRRLAAAGLACTFACGGAPERPVRTILFAVDGIDWRVALPLVAAGRMPTLAGLMERGSYGRLATLRPTASPIIWTTIATGRWPSEHGIDAFEHVEADGHVHLLDSTDRRNKAFWNILTDYGRRVDVVGWWLTHPVERIAGVMVAQTNTASAAMVKANEGQRKGTLVPGAPDQVYPPEREAEMLEIAGRVEARLPELRREVFGTAAETNDPQVQSLFDASLWSLRADAIYTEIARRLASEGPDLLAVYFGGADVAGHRFWRYREPERYADRPPPAQVAALGGVIDDYYVFLDGCMGRILAAAGSGVVRVIVVSDHGMEAARTTSRFPAEARGAELISGEHKGAPPGIFVAAGPGIARMGALPAADAAGRLPLVGSVIDVLPTLLELLRVPRGLDMHGRVLSSVLAGGALAGPSVAPVPTHDSPAWRAERARLASERPAGNDPERMRQLRELGYIR